MSTRPAFSCCNTFISVLSGLLAIPSVILTLYGGISNFNLNYTNLVKEGLASKPALNLVLFSSCISQYNLMFASNPSENIKKEFLLSCEANVVGFYYLYCITAIIVFFAAIAALYASYTKNKIQVFGASMIVPIAFVMSWISMAYAIQFNSPYASRFMNCTGYTTNEINDLYLMEKVCLTGDPNSTLNYDEGKLYLRAVACLTAGLSMSLITMALLMYTTHSSYKELEILKEDDSKSINTPLLHY